MEYYADILIVGGGIIGLCIARELLAQGYENIYLIDKEVALGKHASGRNSGVLHAGIYYPPGSLKAQSCLRGNFLMRAYCQERELPLHETGKVIVTTREEDIPLLHELHRRATANGAKVDLIDECELHEIEPFARTHQLALFSHYTAVVDPKRVLLSLRDDLLSSGRLRLLLGCAFQNMPAANVAGTTAGPIRFKVLINAAGAHCDRIARKFGLAANFRLVPFKGTYRKLRQKKNHLVRGNIYPVPDIRNPFLGVHLSRNVHGEVYLGPTAMPALGRENYGLVSGIDLEAPLICLRDAVLFLANPYFRQVALTEPKKYCPRSFYDDVRKLVRQLTPEDIVPSDKAGIRAQLVNWTTKELIMDFLVLREERSVHILNPISPGFTSAMDLARTVVAQYLPS
ncbi:MAG: L-2-hydroxyglutarate oxidase [Deltaproteobacteria bacterium]|nr:L-2-hydroxyglutarate oxidase [Deltaproteobacteria bacterium]MBW2069907.1 L-2-hydroxyglutarate oxidase [Deltaproteobacteria bacterium]